MNLLGKTRNPIPQQINIITAVDVDVDIDIVVDVDIIVDDTDE